MGELTKSHRTHGPSAASHDPVAGAVGKQTQVQTSAAALPAASPAIAIEAIDAATQILESTQSGPMHRAPSAVYGTLMQLHSALTGHSVFYPLGMTTAARLEMFDTAIRALAPCAKVVAAQRDGRETELSERFTRLVADRRAKLADGAGERRVEDATVAAEKADAKLPAGGASAPPKLDFGKVRPGTVGRTQGPVFNLDSAPSGCHVTYSGDPAISVVHAPTRLAATGESWSIDEQSIKLAFIAPLQKSSHYGTITIYVWWWGGPAPATLTVPVVAHSMEKDDETPDELVARQKRDAEAAAQAKQAEAEQAKTERDLEVFERAHPRVETDAFRRATCALEDAMRQLDVMQLSGIETAKDEVLKYKKRPPPAPSKQWLELAMLALDIATAGIAGHVGKALEQGLKALGEEFPTLAVSDPICALLTDKVKEAIKGSSKLARKNGLTPSHHPSGPDPAKPHPDGSSADPRIAFFQFQRDGVTLSQSGRIDACHQSQRLLLPLLAKDPAAAVAAIDAMTGALRSQLAQTSNVMAHETVRAWVNHLAEEDGSIQANRLDSARGVIDIGFQAPAGPRGEIIVKKAIIRGVSNAIADRFQRLRLLDAGVPIRAYGMPSQDLANLPVTIIRDGTGHVDSVDQTDQANGWIERAGGAKRFLEERILYTSLAGHGVRLETDQDPSLEGG